MENQDLKTYPSGEEALALSKEIYFKDPYFSLSFGARALLRILSYCFVFIFVIATITFLFSDIRWLRWLGVLFLIFLIDKIIHRDQARKSALYLSREKTKEINLALYLRPVSYSILEKALDKSLILGGDFYLYLLEFLTDLPKIKDGLSRLSVPFQEFINKIDDLIKESQKENLKLTKEELRNKIENLLKIAFEKVLKSQSRYIGPTELFSSLGSINDKNISRLFYLFSVEPEDLENVLILTHLKREFASIGKLPMVLGGFGQKPYKPRRFRAVNRAWTSRPTPVLDKFSTDFTELARREKIGFLVGHKEEYTQLVNILSRRNKPNALLIGEAGSGKEALVSHLAFNIIKDNVPPELFDKRLIALNISEFVSGATPDEITLRVNTIMNEIIDAGNIVLYIPNIDDLIETSGEAHLSAADVFLPFILSDAFPLVATVFPKEYKRLIEPRSDFSNAFEIIRVEEISENEAVKILTYEALIFENQYRLIISFNAIKQAVILAHKYFRQKLLPASAEDLLREALADASQRRNKTLLAEDVLRVAQRKINIPLYKPGKEEAEKLLNLEEIIHQRLINQEEAVKSIASALREYRSGLTRSKGPIASFLFVGPTGVGKTELSKILAKVQFGSEEMMVRFDMSEFQTKESIIRFIGSPDGKIVGGLTEAVIQKPYCLILLDEFEKAHSDILNLFLQVFDDGRLTDGLGRVVDFQNTIIIATSNAHSDIIKQSLDAGESMIDIAQYLKKKLVDFFKPELLNRFSRIVVFKELGINEIRAITKLNLNDLAKTLEEQGIFVEFSEEAVNEIARLGYDPSFGARPLRGVISEKIKNVLAEKILKNEIIKGEKIKIIFEDNQFKFLSYQDNQNIENVV